MTKRDQVARNSLAGGAWTTVSRVAGLLRVVTVAAVLGPSYFGNTFQSTNLLPNLTFELLTGTLFSSLLVPSLVHHIDRRDTGAATRLAGGFLGVALMAFSAVAVIAVAAGPLLLRLLSIGVEDPAIVQAQHRVGWLLLAMFMPQVLFYGIAGTGAAVMNAHGKFALAAAAPAFESLGVMATMVASVSLFGSPSLEEVEMGQLLLLGLGTTGAVGLHAAVQWWGARRAGTVLVPRAGWRDAEVRQVLRRAVPSLGYAGLSSLRVFAVLVVANTVPGGVVAFQLALNFFYFPVAVFTRPVAVALLPQLSRHYRERALIAFHDELVQGASLSFFLIVPAAVSYAVLAFPLARAASFGEMATTAGATLVAGSLVALAPGLLGEAGFVVATHASYARGDADGPFRSMLVRTVIALGGMSIAFVFAEGVMVLIGLGLSISLSSAISAAHLSRRLTAGSPRGHERLSPGLLRTFAASLLMAAPAYLVATVLAPALGGRLGQFVALALSVATGLSVFLGLQWAWHSPELASLRKGMSQLRP